MVTMIEPREVVGHFEAREVVSGAPTDILYVWAWSLSFFFKVGNIEKAKPIEIFGIIIN
jgi:hypothetical protein